MGDEDAEAEGEVELFGVLRLPLATGTASGYVGVRHVKKSKKRPWQAWVHIKGERRRCLGSFRKPQEGAVARARALACGPEALPSPRKQAARNSGAALSPRPVSCVISSSSLIRASLVCMCCVCSQTIGRHSARARHAFRPQQRELISSAYGGSWKRARTKRCSRARCLCIHSTLCVRCSDRPEVAARPASAAGSGSLRHGHAFQASAVMRARSGATTGAGSVRVRRTALLWIIRG